MFTQIFYARLSIACLLLCAAAQPATLLAQAQQTGSTDSISGSITGPELGFVFDAQSGVFRHVLGIPGASTLSGSINVGVTIHSAAIAHGLALATVGDDESPAVINLRSDPPSVQLLDGALGAPTSIVLSPGGTAAALHYPEQGTIQIISPLSSSVSVSREISIDETSTISALAISDDGQSVLLGRSGADGSGSVSLIASDGSELFLFSAVQPAAITLLGNSNDALVSDAASSTVYVLRHPADAADVAIVGTSADGLASPKALSASSDRRWVFAVNDGGGSVIVLDLNGGPSRTYACPCDATRLDWVGQGSVFRLSDSSAPMWFLNMDGAESPLFFVPPAADSVATTGTQQNGEPL